MSRVSSVLRTVVPAAVFAIGVLIALACWDRIALPFSNPWNVVGRLADSRFNPANNQLRFAALLLLPIAFAVLLYVLYPGLFGRRVSSPRVGRVTSSPRWTALTISVLIVAAVVCALTYPTEIARGSLDTYHEGLALGAAVSYECGQAPYAEFTPPHGMFQDPLRCVLAFKLCGRSIGAVRTLQSVISVAGFVLLAVLILIVCEYSLLPTLAAFGIVALLLLHPMLPANNRDAFVVLYAVRDVTVLAFLCSIIPLSRAVTADAKRPFAISAFGFLAAFVAIASLGYSIDRGIYLCGALVVLLPLCLVTARTEDRLRCGVSAGVGIIAGALLLIALTRGNLLSMLRYGLLIQPRYFGLLNGFEYPIRSPMFTAAACLVVGIAYWLVVAMLHSLRTAPFAEFVRARFAETALAVCSLLLFASALVRSDWVHVATALFVPSVLLSVIVARTLGARMPSRWRPTAGVVCVVIATIMLVIGIAHIVSENTFSEDFPLRVPDSDYVPENHLSGIAFLRANLQGDENFLSMTGEGSWYYFVGKPCPCRFLDVTFASPDFYQAEMIRDIARRNVKYIILRNASWANDIDGIPNSERLSRVFAYIERTYQFSGYRDDNEIWVRKR